MEDAPRMRYAFKTLMVCAEKLRVSIEIETVYDESESKLFAKIKSYFLENT